MEKDIEKLTGAILSSCTGLNASIVIGACLNVVMTCLDNTPDKAQALAVAKSFEMIASKIKSKG